MIPQRELYRGLKIASLFLGEDKPGLHVAHFNFFNIDNFELVATDGHSLVIINFQVPHGVTGRFSIPYPMVADLLKMFPDEKTPTTEVTVCAWEGKLMFTNGADTHMVQGIPTEDYPPYANIVAKSAAPAAVDVFLDSNRIADIIKYCKPLLKKKAAKTLPFQCPTVKITVSGDKEAPARMQFDLDDDLVIITNLDAYLMPLDPKQAAF